MQDAVKSQIIEFLRMVRCLGYFNYLGHANRTVVLCFLPLVTAA